MGLEVDQSRCPEGVLSTVDGLTEGLGRQDGGRGWRAIERGQAVGSNHNSTVVSQGT